MPIIEKITPRLNISLIENDGKILAGLRLALEQKMSKRLSLAEVVRIAIHEQAKVEKVKV